MRRISLLSVLPFACLLFSTAAQAGSRNPADFPLRVHIFEHTSHSHYHRRSLEEVDGEGRANLFENGQPRGFDYSYVCDKRLMNSIGYETFMARWKKPGATLQLLLPAMGETCDLKVDLKDAVYFKRDGELKEEPVAAYKAWMDEHEYDPEHGKNEPLAMPALPPPPQPPSGSN
jgi:hypothetical protein